MLNKCAIFCDIARCKEASIIIVKRQNHCAVRQNCWPYNKTVLHQYLTDIPRQREEYEVIYGTSWSGISVLLYTKLTILSGV